MIWKALGASASSIFILISQRFLWLIGISIILAVPVNYYLMDLWLQDFAYRITIRTMVFIIAALLSIISTHAFSKSILKIMDCLLNVRD